MTDTLSIDTLITKFKDLSEAAFNSQFGMHNRDYYKVDRMKDQYLGTDIVQEEFGDKFQDLPQAEQDQMTNNGTLGEYGIFHHASKEETTAALCVLAALTAREILQTGTVIEDEHLEQSLALYAELDSKQIELYQDNDFVSKVIATFPEGKITRENFTSAIQPL